MKEDVACGSSTLAPSFVLYPEHNIVDVKAWCSRAGADCGVLV